MDPTAENDMDIDAADVKKVVLDGIVMGPTHCASDGCTAALANARGGAFCLHHEIEFGIDAVSVIAQIRKLWILRLVLFTNPCGRSIS